jgi:hypothetical protein
MGCAQCSLLPLEFLFRHAVSGGGLRRINVHLVYI